MSHGQNADGISHLASFSSSSSSTIKNDLLEIQEKRMELEKLARDIDSANRAKTRFLAKISHEIRTPLNIILGFADLAMDPGQSSEEIQEYLAAIRRNGTELAQIIGNILDLSKAESFSVEIEPVRFNLGGCLQEVCRHFEISMCDKNVRVGFRGVGAVPKEILTDATRLRQILINIIGNAVKFTPNGKVEIEYRMGSSPAADEPLNIEFRVVDSGVGIPLECQSRLFQPFAQADGSVSTRFGGTGLGLLISRQLARALGGDLKLEFSAPGQGSVFKFNILSRPLTTEFLKGPFESESPQDCREKFRCASGRLERTKTLSGCRILLVEDCADNQVLVGRYLKSEGAEVRVAANGREGVKLALNCEFDLVLMDIEMPEQDGYSAVSELRQSGYVRPIVALTAHAMIEERQMAFERGFSDYLTKPVAREALIKSVRKTMARP